MRKVATKMNKVFEEEIEEELGFKKDGNQAALKYVIIEMLISLISFVKNGREIVDIISFAYYALPSDTLLINESIMDFG